MFLQLNGIFRKISLSNNNLILSIVLFAAAINRIIYFSLAHNEIWFKYFYNDALNFHEWGWNIARGHLLGEGVFVQSPFYAYCIGIVYCLIDPEKVMTVQLLQLLAGIVNCYLVYRLSKKYFSNLTSFFACIGYAFYGLEIFYEGTLLSVTIITTLNLLLLLSVDYAVRHNDWKGWGLSGIVLGLSGITRPNILPMAIVIVTGILFTSKTLSKQQIRKYIFLFISGIILVFSPVILRNAIVLGEPMLSVGTGGINFYIGNSVHSPGYLWHRGSFGLNAKTIVEDYHRIAQEHLGYPITYSELSRYWYAEALDEIWQNPEHWLKILIKKSILFFNHEEITTNIDYALIQSRTAFLQYPWISFGIISPLGLLGLIIARKRWRELFILYGMLLVYFIMNVFLWGSSEYRFPIVPILLVFSGVTLESCLIQIRKAHWKTLILYLIGLFLITILTQIELVPKDTLIRWKAYAHYNIGNLYIRDHQWEKANKEFKDAYHLFPGNEAIGIGYVEMLIKTNKYKDALSQAIEMYNRFPISPPVIRVYAKLLTKSGDHAKAIYLRNQLVNMEPNNELYRYELGVTYIKARQDNEANAAFKSAEEINSNLHDQIERFKAQNSKERPIEQNNSKN